MRATRTNPKIHSQSLEKCVPRALYCFLFLYQTSTQKLNFTPPYCSTEFSTHHARDTHWPKDSQPIFGKKIRKSAFSISRDHAHFTVSHSSTKLGLNYAPLHSTLIQLCVRHARFQRFTTTLWKSAYHAHFTLYFPLLNFDSTSLFCIALDRQSLIKCISREILFCHNSQFSFDARNHYLTFFYSISTQTVL